MSTLSHKTTIRRVLKKHQPELILVTGAIGKTLTKEAIYTVFKDKFKTRRSRQSQNYRELSRTILNLPHLSQWSVWGKFFRKDQNYPEVLILEIPVKRSGTLAPLVKILKPRVAVITNIIPGVDFFGSKEKLLAEFKVLLKALPRDGAAVINADDELSFKLAANSKAQVLSFGFSAGATLQAREVTGQCPEGLNFKISYQGSAVPFSLPRVLGSAQIQAALASAAVASYQKMNLLEVSQALQKIISPPGRLNCLTGIKKTTIIDASYDASPFYMQEAIEIISSINLAEDQPHRREKFAVLGDMLGLGPNTEKHHRALGKLVASKNIDYLITVGEKARDLADEARANGMSERQIYSFAKPQEAGKFLQDRLEEGDVVLIKGGRVMGLEKIVKEIMAEPLRARELIVQE